LASPLPNPFTTATQEVTVRVENQLSAACLDETVISFFVDAQPEAFAIMDDFVCDDASNDEEAVFVLSLYNSEILGGQPSGVFEVLYYASAEDAQNGINQLPNSHINTSNPQEIFARIQNNQNDSCFDITSFEIGVYQLPIAQNIEDANVCDIENDGEEQISLSSFNSAIVNGQANTSVSYHLSQSDANNALNALETTYLLDVATIQLYVRLESTISSDCYTTTSFQINLREQPEIDLEPIYYLCDAVPFQLSVASGYDSYEWSTGSTSTSTTIDTPGGYSLTVANFYGDFVCEETFNFQVIQSGLPIITEVIVTDFTQNNNSIEILVEGFGDYEYSIQGFAWQDENIFTSLPLQAEYIVQVRDKNGCGIAFEEAYLLYAPKFFTPNGDGYHDTWNIVNFNRESNGVTHIFDRYGKLLTTLTQGSSGWNGIFNGVLMPSNGYWYRFERGNGQVYTGGFSLIRRGN
jgi:gliding motility-associated-like protein